MLRRPRLVLAVLALLGVACATAPPTAPEPPAWNEARRAAALALLASLRAATPPAADGLRVRLAFTAGADLDLYVTDPQLETVYYANTPVVSGGALREDRRCQDPEPEAVRVETVQFDAPPPGRYRVGIDFPHRCDGGADEVPWALVIEAGDLRIERTGLARWLEFTAIVHEFDVD